MDLDKALAESQALDAIYADIGAKHKAACASFDSKWPNHCRACGGWGGFHTMATRTQPEGFDVCSVCAAEGKCGRCGAASLDEDGNGPCNACGWNYDDGLPGDPF